jgi:hypothetical protein
MRVEHEAKVRTKDGRDAGHVKHAIWDPNGSRITQYVVATGGLLGHDVIVSPELLESAERDGSAIVLNMTKHEVDELAHYESTEFTPPPADWHAPSVHGFPTGGYLWPVRDAETVPAREAPPSEGISRGPKVNKST